MWETILEAEISNADEPRIGGVSGSDEAVDSNVMKNIVNIVLKRAVALASADMNTGTPRSSCLNLKSGCRTLRNLSCGVEGGGVEKLSRVEVVGRERPILAVPIHRMRTAMVHRKNAALWIRPELVQKQRHQGLL